MYQDQPIVLRNFLPLVSSQQRFFPPESASFGVSAEKKNELNLCLQLGLRHLLTGIIATFKL